MKPKINSDFNKGDMYFWSKFGNPSLTLEVRILTKVFCTSDPNLVILA